MSDLSTGKMTSDGQITISEQIRQQLGLKPDAKFLEVVVNNCILLIPQDEVLHDLAKKSHDAFTKAGITADQLLEGLKQRREDNVRQQYPELFND